MRSDDDEGGELITIPEGGQDLAALPSRKQALNTLGRVAAELASIYRLCRSGKMDLGDGARLTFILGQLARALEKGTLESRIEALEEQTQRRRFGR